MAQQESYNPISNIFKTLLGPSCRSVESFASKCFFGQRATALPGGPGVAPFKFSPI